MTEKYQKTERCSEIKQIHISNEVSNELMNLEKKIPLREYIIEQFVASLEGTGYYGCFGWNGFTYPRDVKIIKNEKMSKTYRHSVFDVSGTIYKGQPRLFIISQSSSVWVDDSEWDRVEKAGHDGLVGSISATDGLLRYIGTKEDLKFLCKEEKKSEMRKMYDNLPEVKVNVTIYKGPLKEVFHDWMRNNEEQWKWEYEYRQKLLNFLTNIYWPNQDKRDQIAEININLEEEEEISH